ncbi:hypothetical protein EV138_1495 [Kribbella voronezhensis]|uniref:Oxidoreductase n=1 Tax=Kribbella voronezhensis TaxID=2512212 RepID=A0A4R7T9S8_9ACTN|nr:hypothetical protein [Kribbella voronezhensis]TDU87957.1 hypothetical protein EV138_1495 [Kribbella voronezhensis]
MRKAFATRLAVALCLATSGYIHAQLYVRGYHAIPTIGTSFRWDAAASFAVAALLLVGSPLLLRLAAAGLCLSGLAGFTVSRTIGLFGFTERGWQPAPQALLSVLAWIVALALLLTSFLSERRHRGERHDTLSEPVRA